MLPKIYYLTLLLCLGLLSLQAQHLTGRVRENYQGKNQSLPGASVYWLNSAIATTTDSVGRFHISIPDSGSRRLIVSFVGYTPDTLTITSQRHVEVILKGEMVLQEVEVKGRQESISMLNPANAQLITKRELTKAACCNLSESFETNATVEVSQADAVTGAKQIQMLGLEGTYTLMTVENYPTLRGLAVPYRLSFISGTWIDGIDIIKGMGSVINGYESMTGQINVRLKDVHKAEQLYFNQYVNSLGKFDTNLNLVRPVNKRWTGSLLLHTDHLLNRVDRNKDNFMDLPLSSQYSGFSKWRYQGENGLEGEYGLGVLKDTRTGGQLHATPAPENASELQGKPYRTKSDIERLEAYAKTGYVSQAKPYQSMGLILSGVRHVQDAKYGLRNYDAKQHTFYSNLIFQSALGNTNHSYKAGLSYSLDRFDEVFKDSAFARTESVPGAFVEYVDRTFEKLTAVAGARVDYHNLYGPIFTPRLNLKYDFTEQNTWRIAIGKGFRVPNPIAENTGMLVSNRAFIFTEKLRPEEAWSYGTSFTRRFNLGSRNATLVADYYFTNFRNQLVVDMYSNANQLRFSNLHGRSFSHSTQLELQAEVLERFDVKVAYKYFDVQTNIAGQMVQRQFNSRNRFFVNLGYATNFEKWKFDLTTQFYGRKALPHDALEHHTERLFTYSPSYFLFNGQITRSFLKWDVYLGGENLLGYRQPNPIVDVQNPYGPNFDAGMLWAPVVGRVIYAGVRYKINKLWATANN